MDKCVGSETMKLLGRYSTYELEQRLIAESLSTDANRQAAYASLDSLVRKRLQIPEDRYYTVLDDGVLMLDEDRDRPKAVKKISKSDQS